MPRKRPPKTGKPSTAKGHARCQGITGRGQCTKKARPGYQHCAEHGGGDETVDAQRDRTNAQSRAANAETPLDFRGLPRRELYARYPALQQLYDKYAGMPLEQLADFREVLIESRALADWQATFPAESDAMFFMSRVATIGRSVENIERALRAQRALKDNDAEMRLRLAQVLQPILIGLEQLVVSFVIPDQRTEAMAMLRDVVATSVLVDHAINQAKQITHEPEQPTT